MKSTFSPPGVDGGCRPSALPGVSFRRPAKSAAASSRPADAVHHTRSTAARDPDPAIRRRLDGIVALLALDTAVVVFAFATDVLEPGAGVLPLALSLLVLALVLALLGVAVRSGWWAVEGA